MKRTCKICDYIDNPDKQNDLDRKLFFDNEEGGWICSDCLKEIKSALKEFGDPDDGSMEVDAPTLPEMYE